MRVLILILLLGAAHWVVAGEFPRPAEGDAVLKDFKFASGESLPELRIHYRTLGQPVRDSDGTVVNAILVLHGTGGAGSNFVEGAGREMFAGVLFGNGQPLDATRYYIVLPDNIGHGKSSKPSDGLRGHFPHYGYEDMVRAHYRLLTEELKVDHLRLVMGTSDRTKGPDPVLTPFLARTLRCPAHRTANQRKYETNAKSKNARRHEGSKSDPRRIRVDS